MVLGVRRGICHLVFTGLTVGKTLFQALMAEAQKNELQQFRQEITHVAGWMICINHLVGVDILTHLSLPLQFFRPTSEDVCFPLGGNGSTDKHQFVP